MAKTKLKNKIIKSLQKYRFHVLSTVLSLILVAVLILTYQFILQDKFYPQTFVGDQNISFLTKSQALKKIEQIFKKRAKEKIYFNYPQEVFSIDLATASANIDYSILDEILNSQHAGTYLEIIVKQLQTIIFQKRLTPNISLKIDKQLDQIALQVERVPQNAQLLFSENTTEEGTPSADIQIKEGKDGLGLERQALEKTIADYLISGKYQINLPLNSIPPKITTEHVKHAKEALERSLKESVKLKFQGNLWVIDTKQLLALLDLTTGENLLLDKDKTQQYIKKIAQEIDQDVQEGLFEFNTATKRVTAFKPSQEGRKLDTEKTYQLIIQALTSAESKNITLPVAIIKPKNF